MTVDRGDRISTVSRSGDEDVKTTPNMAEENIESEILIFLFRFHSHKVSQQADNMLVLLGIHLLVVIAGVLWSAPIASV